MQFNADLVVINKCLDELIQTAKDTRQEEDYEAMQNRDYAKVRWEQPARQSVRCLADCWQMPPVSLNEPPFRHWKKSCCAYAPRSCKLSPGRCLDFFISARKYLLPDRCLFACQALTS